MSILNRPLETHVAWIRRTDGHATHRVPLLVRAERVLSGEESADEPQRRELAAQLERWRYQHLNERRGRLSERDRSLAEVLDLAANSLAGRPRRQARWPRGAVFGNRDDGAIQDGLACLDPAVPLEDVTRRAAELTIEHHSATMPSGPPGRQRQMLLYAPLYLSSYCVSHCVYCGFRYPADIERKQLSPAEAVEEARILRDRGFRHVLLVAGDYPQRMTTAYYVEVLGCLKELGLDPAVEIAPQTTGAYAEMAAAGACGVTLYQETYHEELYGLYHPRGPKVSFDWRLEGLERAAEAGMRRLGLGILLGLADPCGDLRAMMRHGWYLGRRFPECPLAFSLPRIREAPAEFDAPYPVDDETFIRMYCALRVAFPKATLVLSTRERAALRGRLARICVTQMSAGSCTSPGGYAAADEPRRLGKQFPICDHRPPAEVAASLHQAGIQPVWQLLH